MDIGKVAACEEGMNSLGKLGTDMEHSVKGIGSAAEMRNCSQELKGMLLLLERIILGRGSENGYLLGVKLKRLLLVHRFNKSSLNLKGGADALLQGNKSIRSVLLINNDLHSRKAGSVIQRNEAYGLGIANGANPTANGYILINILFRCCENIAHIDMLHINPSQLKDSITIKVLYQINPLRSMAILQKMA